MPTHIDHHFDFQGVEADVVVVMRGLGRFRSSGSRARFMETALEGWREAHRVDVSADAVIEDADVRKGEARRRRDALSIRTRVYG